jgi:CRP/FNR family transcriptional regulator, anaerobic regulatory protein
MNQLLDFLGACTPLSNHLKIRLKSILQHAQYKKKSFLLREGQICNNICFIDRGLVKVFYKKDDLEICSGLVAERGVAVSVVSFFKREVSDEYIQAIEDTEIFFITYNELEALYDDFSEFNIIGRKLITEYYVMSEVRNYILRRHTATEKFNLFNTHFGHLTARVSRKDIASYLGINLETLSRLG